MDCESNTPYLFSSFLFISRFFFQYRAKRTFCSIILQIYRLAACVLGNIQYRNRANQTKSKRKFQRFHSISTFYMILREIFFEPTFMRQPYQDKVP